MAEQGHLLERLGYYLEMARQGALESYLHLPTREEYQAFVQGPDETVQEWTPEAVEQQVLSLTELEGAESPEARQARLYDEWEMSDAGIAAQDAEIAHFEATYFDAIPEALEVHQGASFDDALDELDPDEGQESALGAGEHSLHMRMGFEKSDLAIDTSASEDVDMQEQLAELAARLEALAQDDDRQQHIDRREGMSY